MKVGIIIEENPISRCYINILKTNSTKLKNIILHKKKMLIPNFISLKLAFNMNNYWPLLFLKKKNFLYLTHQIENYFNFPRNFCVEMYRFENIYDVSDEMTFTDNENINRENSINLIKKSENNFFFNTGKQIYKNVLKINKKFIHIHPGYLPEIKGADGSLWHIKNNNNLGVSSFFMNEKIDGGSIITREKFPMPKFSLRNYEELNTKMLYKLWFSFFDPLLRGTTFRKFLKKEDLYNCKEKAKNLNNLGGDDQLYSFMNENQLRETFDKIFKNEQV